MPRIISWNINGQRNTWNELKPSDADVFLLQEAPAPLALPYDIHPQDSEPWETEGSKNRPWRTAVVRVGEGIRMNGIPERHLGQSGSEQLGVSRLGTIAAAKVEFDDLEEPITLVSVYGVWEKAATSRWIMADAAVHRLISDVSSLIGKQKGHQIIVAGDFNILHGYGEKGSKYWARRYENVFQRMTALGLEYCGPQAPNGEQASPKPSELPTDSLDVPTYRKNQGEHESATRQLDFVFASSSLRDRMRVRALNRPEEWGPSDHCRIQIDLETASN
ncbi:MAG TPA: hypothetical protein DIU35_01440 [Candidatus Latescibacteria bacterium]|nr:hypothetical protein [Candidatus Latescibacterota bacterium]